jgi:hypothetical protein
MSVGRCRREDVSEVERVGSEGVGRAGDVDQEAEAEGAEADVAEETHHGDHERSLFLRQARSCCGEGVRSADRDSETGRLAVLAKVFSSDEINYESYVADEGSDG